MDYSKIYRSLIEKGQGRNKAPDAYYERHHIIPKCLGGTDDSINLVLLTPEEHYVAHQLLVKLNPGHFGLLSAVQLMSGNKHCTNRLYGWLRRKVSNARKGRKMSDEQKAKLSEATKRRYQNLEEREKTSKALKGKIVSDSHRENIKASKSKSTISEESRKKMGDSNRGKKKSSEHLAKMKEASLKVISSDEVRRKISEGKKLSWARKKGLLNGEVNVLQY